MAIISPYTRASLALAVLLAAGRGAAAQTADPSAPPPGGARTAGATSRQTVPGGATPEDLRRGVMERMRAMRAWKLSESLRLDEATSAKLFPMLSRYDDRELEIMKEVGGVMRALRAEVEAPKPDNARLVGYLDKLIAARIRQRTLEDEKIRELRKVLSPVQQAKLLMVLPRIDRHFQQRIGDAMDRRRQRPFDEF